MAIKRQDLIDLLIEGRPTLTDAKALQFMAMYPHWAEGIDVKADERYQYNDRLYKVAQAHTTQSDWTPDATPAMWTVIDVEHSGTIDDPIPAARGMEYVKGKYYIENEVIYLMNRAGMAEGESVTLQYMPSELVGHYFEVVSGV